MIIVHARQTAGIRSGGSVVRFRNAESDGKEAENAIGPAPLPPGAQRTMLDETRSRVITILLDPGLGRCNRGISPHYRAPKRLLRAAV